MSPSPQLAPPGSSTYTSGTMHVGDGTWDAGRDDFLLPPLVGLNFATMRYNGMGNRFFTLVGYHSVVKAHGILAAITFLFLIPAAIFIRRFGGRRPQLARQLHIWLNSLTLLLSTAIIILGAFAVGPSRALTNPHHGIGVAIYTLIWVQILGGCLVYRSEKKRRQPYIPLKAMIHHWLGRMIALLGLAQVPLGLTLYGSPLSLFVLYTLWVLFLLILYFILEFIHERRISRFHSEDGSYTEEEVSRHEERKGWGFGKLALAAGAGIGLASLFRNRSSGKHAAESSVTHSSTGTYSSYGDDKYSEPAPRKTGWGRRLLEIGAIGGGIAAARKVFGRQREPSIDESVSGHGPYGPRHDGDESMVTDSMSRIEEARPPPRPVTPNAAFPGQGRPQHPLAQPPMTPGSGRRPHGDDYLDDDSYMSGSPSRIDRRHGGTFREALVAGGAFAAVRTLFKNRGQRKEDERAENLRKQRIEEERLQRMNSAHRYTGDGSMPARRNRHQYANSQTASDISGTMDGSILPDGRTGMLPAAGIGAAAAGALADRQRIRPMGQDPVISHPGPASAMTGAMPPVPPPHGTDPQSSGSELYTTASGQQRHRHHSGAMGATATAAALTAGAAAGSSRRQQNGNNTDSIESAPVSLKVKMHNDGRHVTLRRLTEEEAAAQREARRQERRASATRRRRNSSMSNSSGGEDFASGSADQRWCRTEALEAQQAAQNQAANATRFSPMPGASTSGPIYPMPPTPGTQQVLGPHGPLGSQLPPPPPIPASTSNLGPAGSITSPGTETSGGTEYANNRRRRRAERAQARLAREGRSGNTVDFT